MGSPASLPADLVDVRDALREWYEENHRPLPWRDTTDPYPILVAEVMSQQTQLERVITPFRAFIDRWPTVEALAAADLADVLAFWSDHALGYNSRARYLTDAAALVVEEYHGQIPDDPSTLQKLPGVGPYTANAVASLAFNNGDAVVDTNVKRVLHRAFDVPDEDARFESVANDLMPPGDSRTWNNAIMELGGVVCSSTPRCDESPCPWRRWCHAYRTGDFTAPDVPTQPSFTGSRRQYRGRIIRTLAAAGSMEVDRLGRAIRVDYGSEGADREWLAGILEDLESEGLIGRQGTEDAVEVYLAE